jgi:hypothetical protein
MRASPIRAASSPVIKDFCKQVGVDNKQVQAVVRLAKKNGEWLGFLGEHAGGGFRTHGRGLTPLSMCWGAKARAFQTPVQA